MSDSLTNGAASGSKAGVAVYCGSHLGNHSAYQLAALSVGRAIAASGRPLVYGGGSKGIMGTVSGAALLAGGKVTAVAPYSIMRKGGEGRKADLSQVHPDVKRALEVDRQQPNVELIVVDSMHDRKVKMAKRVDGFIGLPGGFGTYEEVLEVTTWTQLGIHQKPTVLLNIRGFYSNLRNQIQVSHEAGFIGADHLGHLTFVDCPPDQDETTFDWGNAALQAIDNWKCSAVPLFDWTLKMGEGVIEEEYLYQPPAHARL